MPKVPAKPQLTNRGAAGLLTKAPVNGEAAIPLIPPSHNKIAAALIKFAVPIDSLTVDPNNARLHPERNLQAIMESLSRYGQVKTIAVRSATKKIMAGNGTFEAAKALGWTKIAAAFIDLTEADAAGYGLADNRTAELARWDFEVVKRIDRLLTDAGESHMVGWSVDELSVLRMAEWTPPPEFPVVDETLHTDHQCPKCGYKFSGNS